MVHSSLDTSGSWSVCGPLRIAAGGEFQTYGGPARDDPDRAISSCTFTSLPYLE